MLRRLLAFFVSACCACTANLAVPTGAQITCSSDSECPNGYGCPGELGYCVTNGTLLPTVAVSFSQPGEGDVEVSLTGKLVIVLNLEATLPPASIVTIVSADGSDSVGVDVATTASANTLVATPKRRLFPLTDYVLTVLPGIAPAPGVFGTSSTTTWVVHFKTTVSSDTEAPLPVAKLVVSENATGATSPYTVQWNPSPSNDVAGAIVLRSSGSPVVTLPEAGHIYLVGQSIGSATVVYSGGLASVDDTPPSTAGVYYAVASYDSALNYSPLSQPPRAALAGAPQWCPDETGSFTIASADTGTAQLQVSDTPAAVNATRYPATPVALNTPIPFAADSVFVPGVRVYFRAVGVSDDASYLGPPLEVTLPDPDLGLTLLTSAPLKVGAILANVSLQHWPAYEAQIDRNPGVNTETWSSLENTSQTLTAIIAQPGSYKFRARPVVTGCATIPYIEGDEFVLADRADACRLSGPDQSKCNSSGSVVFMSEGTTSAERLEVVAGVEYYGGFTSDFYSRDLTLHETKLTFPTNTIRIQSVSAASNTIIDGFHVINGGTAGAFDGALLVSDDASPTISHCIIERTTPGRAVQVLNSAPRFSRNTITGPTAVEVGGSGTASATFDHNIITGSSDSTAAFYCSGATINLTYNTIRHQLASATGTSSAITVNQGCSAIITGNTLSATTSTSATGVASTGIRFNWGRGTILSNRISAGRGAQTTGIFVATQAGSGDPGSILIANNTILAGSGTTALNWGTPRKGIILDASVTPVALRTVRVTNNLVIGETDFDGFALDTSFATLGSMQNNVVAGPAGSAFLTSYHSAATDQSIETFETDACGLAPPTIATGNSLLVSSAANLFVNAAGADSSLVTIDDNDWHLAASAPASIREGGLLLVKAETNCGGTTCGAPANADCGGVTEDLDALTRSAPYSVGAYR